MFDVLSRYIPPWSGGENPSRRFRLRITGNECECNCCVLVAVIGELIPYERPECFGWPIWPERVSHEGESLDLGCEHHRESSKSKFSRPLQTLDLVLT